MYTYYWIHLVGKLFAELKSPTRTNANSFNYNNTTHSIGKPYHAHKPTHSHAYFFIYCRMGEKCEIQYHTDNEYMGMNAL